MTLDLSGLMVAQVTPFTPGGQDVDPDWLPPHLRFLESQGVDSILTLGTNGEGPSVGLEERRRVVETVVRHKGGMRVVAGCGCVALPDTIRAANDALDAGADALMVLPPYYFHQAEPSGLVAYFSSVLDALPGGAKALLYNIPPYTHVDIPDEVVLALLDLHADTLIGIKDSGGDAARSARYVSLSDSLTVLAGSDHLHDRLYAAGCAGGVSGLANATPALFKTILHLARTGGDAGRAQRQANELRETLRPFPGPAAIKHLITLVTDLPLTTTRPPQRDLSPGEAQALSEAVGRYLVGEDH